MKATPSLLCLILDVLFSLLLLLSRSQLCFFCALLLFNVGAISIVQCRHSYFDIKLLSIFASNDFKVIEMYLLNESIRSNEINSVLLACQVVL